jgi:hypothetical protein
MWVSAEAVVLGVCAAGAVSAQHARASGSSTVSLAKVCSRSSGAHASCAQLRTAATVGAGTSASTLLSLAESTSRTPGMAGVRVRVQAASAVLAGTTTHARRRRGRGALLNCTGLPARQVRLCPLRDTHTQLR